MDESTANALVFGIIAVSAASAVSVSAWSNARRLEREAYYRNEAIKKIAEMEGTISPQVLDALKSALHPARSEEAEVITEASVRVEALRRIDRMGDNEAYNRFLKEWGSEAASRRTEALRLAGAIMIAVSIGLMVFLAAATTHAIFLVGLIPLLVGVVLLGASFSRRPSPRS